MAITNVTNEVQSKVALFGTEQVRGDAVVPTGRLFGTWSASRSRALKRTEEATGSYDRFTAIDREEETFSGSYEETPSYESLPSLLRYGLAGGDNPVADSNAVVAYTRRQVPLANADNVDTATIYSGVEGLPFLATGVRWNEWTLSWSPSNGWSFSANPIMKGYHRQSGSFMGVATGGTATSITMTGASETVDKWVGSYIYLDYGTHIGPVRVVTDNTADTWTWEGDMTPAPTTGTRFMVVPQLPIVADGVEREIIKGDMVDVYVDKWKSDGTAIGSTLVSERINSFSLTSSLSLTEKKRAHPTSRVGRGARVFSGSIGFEFDRWDEYDEWDQDDFISIRVAKKGSIVDPTAGTRKLMQLDLDKVAWDGFTEEAEDHNMIANLTFLGYNPLGAPNPIFASTTVNTLATLP